MSAETLPEWVRDVEGATFELSLEQQTVTFRIAQTPAILSFGQVPGDWSINAVATRSHCDVTISCEGQSKHANWTLESSDGSVWRIDSTISSLTVRARGAHNLCRLHFSAISPHFILGPGTYEVHGSEPGNGSFTAADLAEANQRPGVRLQGTAKLTRFTGGGHQAVTIATEADDLEVSGAVPQLTLLSECRNLTVIGAKSLDLNAVVSETVDISCTQFTTGDILASGSISANLLHFTGEIAPEAGRLEVTVTGQFVASKGGRDLDLILQHDPKIEQMPQAVIGGQDGGAGLALTPYPSGPRDAGAPVSEAPKLTRTGRMESWGLDNSSILGEGIVHVGGSLKNTREINAHTLLVDGDLEFDSADPERPGNVPGLRAGVVAVGGHVHLASGEAVISRHLQCSKIVSGTVTDGEASAVILMSECEDATVRSSGIAALRGSITERAVVRSALNARDRLDLHGLPDELSSLELAGGGLVNAELLPDTRFTWLPGAPWNEGNPKLLEIHARVPKLEITGTSANASDAVIETAQGVRIDSLELNGSVTLVANTTAADNGPQSLDLKPGSHVVVAAGLKTIHVLRVDGVCTVELAPTNGTLDAIVHPAAGGGGELRLLLNGGRMRLDSPDPTTDGSFATRAPRTVVAEGGSVEIHDYIESLACIGTGSAAVTVDVGKTGVIEALTGEFQTHTLDGRIVGAKASRGKHAPAVLTRWPNASKSGERQGELTNVDISKLPAGEVAGLASLHVLSPNPKPLISYAKLLGPRYDIQLLDTLRRRHPSLHVQSSPKIQSEAQKLREIADIVRSRANSSATFTAAQWAASHAHALSVGFSWERAMRWFHRLVGYGVRPLPALTAYAVWTAGVAAALYLRDPGSADDCTDTEFVPGPYDKWQSLQRALLLPATILRSDLGGATPFRPAFDNALAHYLLVLGTGVSAGFAVVAIRNYLLRPKSDI